MAVVAVVVVVVVVVLLLLPVVVVQVVVVVVVVCLEIYYTTCSIINSIYIEKKSLGLTPYEGTNDHSSTNMAMTMQTGQRSRQHSTDV